jgi:glycosyltransferase involved in cell wall biosynthesis
MKVLCFIGGYGLAYDERQRKEAIELQMLGCDVEIIVAEPSNKAKRGKTLYGVDFHSISLFTRKILPQKRFLIVKAIEMHLKLFFIFLTKKWDVLWIHDHDMAPLLIYGCVVRFFSKKKKIVWDQHELGSQKFFDNALYHMLLHIPNAVIHANHERANLLKERVPRKCSDNFHVIENFPEYEFIQSLAGKLNYDFERWLNGSSFILFQGGAMHHRKVMESIEAIHFFDDMKLLILGPCSEEIRTEIEQRWPDYRKKVFITGWVNPDMFIEYMDNSIASLVFYENLDLNHWLCAPNRFYNALLRAIPIISGPNPTMANIITEYNCGIVCQENGADPEEIYLAITRIMNERDFYRSNCLRIREQYTWESQNQVFDDIINKS